MESGCLQLLYPCPCPRAILSDKIKSGFFDAKARGLFQKFRVMSKLFSVCVQAGFRILVGFVIHNHPTIHFLEDKVHNCREEFSIFLFLGQR
jgi:hypothetical protein